MPHGTGGNGSRTTPRRRRHRAPRLRPVATALPRFSGRLLGSSLARVLRLLLPLGHCRAQALATRVIASRPKQFVRSAVRGSPVCVVHPQGLPVPGEAASGAAGAGLPPLPPRRDPAGRRDSGRRMPPVLFVQTASAFRGRGHTGPTRGQVSKRDRRPPLVVPSRAGGVPTGMRPRWPSVVHSVAAAAPGPRRPRSVAGVSFGLRPGQRSRTPSGASGLRGCSKPFPQSPVAARLPLRAANENRLEAFRTPPV